MIFFKMIMIPYDIICDIICITWHPEVHIWRDLIDRTCLNDWFSFEIRKIDFEDGHNEYQVYEHGWWFRNEGDTRRKDRISYIRFISSCNDRTAADLEVSGVKTMYLENPEMIYSRRLSKRDVLGKWLCSRYSVKYHR